MQNDTYISMSQFVFGDPQIPKPRYLPSKRQKTSKTNCYIEMYFGGLATFPRYLSTKRGQTSKVHFDVTTFPRPKFHTYISNPRYLPSKIQHVCIFKNFSWCAELLCMFVLWMFICRNNCKYREFKQNISTKNFVG